MLARINLRSLVACCGTLLVVGGTASTAAGSQLVFLDFDTFTTGSEYVYSAGERTAIKETLTGIYAPFPIDFTLTDPGAFAASRLLFNKGGGVGVAESIDFRNLDDDDSADVNAEVLLDIWESSGELHPDGRPIARDPVSGTFPSDMMVVSSAHIAAHEFGHLMGLRHHDAFGPVGTGIGVSSSKYTPAFTGPDPGTGGAPFTSSHVMGMNSSVSLSPSSLFSPLWLSERSSVKLEFITSGTVTAETGAFHNDVTSAQPIGVDPMGAPNTLMPPEPGAFSGPVIPARAGAVTGFLGESTVVPGVTETDYYVFDGTAGELVTVEVISHVMRDEEGGRIVDWVDPVVYLLDGLTGGLLPYHSPPAGAINDDQFESVDSILFDVVLPTSGPFIVEVGPKFGMIGRTNAADGGEYELYVYTHTDIPDMVPCDFDGDTDCDIDDLNSMLAEGPIAPGVPVIPGVNQRFDLDGDGLITLTDQDLWLEDAGLFNGFGSAYLSGDANLDGIVDISDFFAWNDNRFSASLAWDLGNFNGDAVIDLGDFFLWNENKFLSSDRESVPEPATTLLLLIGLGTLGFRRPRQNQ